MCFECFLNLYTDAIAGILKYYQETDYLFFMCSNGPLGPGGLCRW